MNVSCPQCSTVYRVDPAKVPAEGVRARCSACGDVIPVGMSGEPRHGTGVAAGATGGAAGYPAAPQAPMTSPTYPTPGAQPALSYPMHVGRPVSRTPMPGTATAQPARQATPARPATLPPLRPTPRSPWPPVSGGATPPAAAEAPIIQSPPVPAAGLPSVKPPAPAPGERRPINPFLSRDPGIRAKRLARALVSDMVAYYPAKHSEGLQRGTLKDLFREEIKKSYDEYVSQVGPEVARTTMHFQDALNEILGAGRRIF